MVWVAGMGALGLSRQATCLPLLASGTLRARPGAYTQSLGSRVLASLYSITHPPPGANSLASLA